MTTQNNIELKKPSAGEAGAVDSTEIENKSGVAGTTVTAALNTLAAAGGTIPFTAKGDIPTYDGAALAILPKGADGLFLRARAAAANGIDWGKPTPLAAKGDILAFSTVDAALTVGADGKILVADSGEATGLNWIVNPVNLLVAAGDILTYDGNAKVIIKLDVGADGKILTADSGEDCGLLWQTAPGAQPRSYAYVVAPAGGDYATVSALLTAHPAPASFFVKDGTYDESAAPVVIPANTLAVFESHNAIIDVGAGYLSVGAASIASNGTVRGTLATNNLIKCVGNFAQAVNMKGISTAVGNPAAAQWIMSAGAGLLGIKITNPILEFAGDYSKEGGIEFLSDSGRIDNIYAIMGAGTNTPIIKAVSNGLTIDGLNLSAPGQSNTALDLTAGAGYRMNVKNIGTGTANFANITAVNCNVSDSACLAFFGTGNKLSRVNVISNFQPGASADLTTVSDSKLASALCTSVFPAIYTNTVIGTYTDHANTRNTQFNNCEINGAAVNFKGSGIIFSGRILGWSLEIDGDHNSLRGSFESIDIYGDYNNIMGSNVGLIAGGGTGTITIQAGATGNTVVGCSTDAVVVDGGTASQVGLNSVYA